MNLWIKNQIGTKMLKVENFGYKITDLFVNGECVGKYTSELRTKAIFDDICNLFEDKFILKNCDITDDISEMFNIAKQNGNCVKGESSVQLMNNTVFVYQVPKE